MSRFLLYLVFLLGLEAPESWAQPKIDSVSDGTVRVVARSSTKINTGSGFVATAQGHVITNQHVVRGGLTFSVILNGERREIPARIVGESRALDLAILKTDIRAVKPLPISVTIPKAGEDVWALGFPGNADRLGEQVSPTITKGVLSNVFVGSWHKNYELHLIQHSAGISPGSSGGPLVDDCGRVIGVNSKGSGSRVLRNSSGKVVDVFAGTQIYFSSHILEAIEFFKSHGVVVSPSKNACETAKPASEVTEQEIADLRREIDAARSEAAQSGEVSSAELQRLEKQLAAATSIYEEQSRNQYLTLGASVVAAATGLFLLVLIISRPVRQQIIRIPMRSKTNKKVIVSKSTAAEAREKPSSTTTLKLSFSNGYIGGQKTVPVPQGETAGYVIGRLTGICDLVIDDPRLSIRHSRITCNEQGELFLEDLNSDNGTVVDSLKLHPFEKHKIQKGSLFSCGTMKFRVQ